MEAFLKTGVFDNSAHKEVMRQNAHKKTVNEKNEKKTPSFVPWVEKYRPKTITEVAYQDEVVSMLKHILMGSDLPNLLFYGPPGTGKTSTILAAARDLFTSDLFRDRVLELNASDERGINVIREKVKDFAQLTASGLRPDGKKCPPYKIIILDEADCLTQPAQAALRRTMEKETKTTRFCLICNYVSRIIDPITSRCAKFRFKPLSSEVHRARLEEIASAENIQIENDSVIDELISISEGDLRKSITAFQSAFRLRGLNEPITIEDIHDIAGIVPSNVIIYILDECRSNSFDRVERMTKKVILDGYSVTQIITQLHDYILSSTTTDSDFTDKRKSIICRAIAITDSCLTEGADEFLQLFQLNSILMKAFQTAG